MMTLHLIARNRDLKCEHTHYNEDGEDFRTIDFIIEGKKIVAPCLFIDDDQLKYLRDFFNDVYEEEIAKKGGIYFEPYKEEDKN